MDSEDFLRISGWEISVGLGVYDHELTTLQPVRVDLSLYGDFRPAGDTDDFALALDYKAFQDSLEAHLNGRRWGLLEALAEEICRFALKSPPVSRVKLTLEKPLALAPALISYTLTRRK